MFGNDALPSRIYAYKCKPPGPESLALLEDQFALGARYRNDLVAVERRRREAVEAVILELAPDYHEADARWRELDGQLEERLEAVKARNKAQRRRTATPAEREELRRLREERAAVGARRKELKAAQWDRPEVADRLKAIGAEAYAAGKALYNAAAGLFWPTKLFLGATIPRKGAPPKFRRYDGEGVAVVQIQLGQPLCWTDLLLGRDGRVRVRILPAGLPAVSRRGRPLPAADPASNRSRSKAWCELSLRVGTAPGGREPVFATTVFRLHRHPPADAQVKWVSLRRRRIGTRWWWEVQFTLSRPAWPREGRAESGRAGLDVGWRARPGGMRVAYLVGDDGADEEILVPDELLRGWSKAESLTAIRDRQFNAARDRLAGWLREARAAASPPPEWFLEATATLHAWRSRERLSRFVAGWRDRRFPGDEAIFPELEAWRRQEDHLHDWEDHQRTKTIRRRDELYRRLADRLGRTYAHVHIEDTDWRALARRAEAEGEADLPGPARRQMRIAAVGRLLDFVREAVAHAEVRKAADTTRRCRRCGHLNDFPREQLRFTCAGCGVEEDQDRNAAFNLLLGEDATPAAADADPAEAA